MPAQRVKARNGLYGGPQMSIFAQASKVIGTLAGLAGLGQQGAGLGLGLSDFTDGGFSPEYIAGSATSSFGDFGGIAANLGTKSAVGRYFGVPGSAKTPAQVSRTFNLGNRVGPSNDPKGFQQGISIVLWTLTIVEILELTT